MSDIKRFEELLDAWGDARVLGNTRDIRAARLALMEYVRELIEPKPRDPCVGDSRDTGVW